MSLIVEYETFPIKRVTVKTTPTMSIQSVVEQACEQLALQGTYALYYKQSHLQPSLSVRLANIPSGSRLQLIPKADSSGSDY
jgi:hypothetical protein